MIYFDDSKYLVSRSIMTIETSTERAGALLRELMTMIFQRSAGEMMRAKSELGLSMPQFVTLHLLRDYGALSISAIAEKLDLSLAATSHLVDRMVQQSLVERTEDPIDRRQKRVVIASGGCTVLDRLADTRMREAERIANALPPELGDQLEHVLEQVIAQLKHTS
jgi:DNA-binding MarR family transcriptional regulator